MVFRNRLLVLLTVAAAGCHTAFHRPHGGFTAQKTAHITYYSNEDHTHAEVHQELEAAYTAFGGSFFTHLPEERIEVLGLQGDPGRFGKLYGPRSDAPTAWSLENVPSRQGIGKDGLIVLEPSTVKGAPSIRTASLQLASQFVFRAFPRAPLWFQTGFTHYLATYRIHYSGDAALTCYGADVGLAPVRGLEWRGDAEVVHAWKGAPMSLDAVLASAAPALRGSEGRVGSGASGRIGRANNVLLPVDAAFTQGWYGQERHGRRWFAFTSFSIVSYLVHGERGRNKAAFPLFLNALSRGLDTEAALAEAYPHVPLDDLDELVTDFVYGAQKPRERLDTEAQGLCFQTPSIRYVTNPPERTPVPEAEISAVVQDIERLPLWQGYTMFYPEDVIAAEAAKRPGVGQGAGAPAGAAATAGTAAKPGTPTGPTKPPEVEIGTGTRP